MMMATVAMWTAANAISSNDTGVASDGTAIAVGRANGNYPNAITLNSQGQMSLALIRFDTVAGISDITMPLEALNLWFVTQNRNQVRHNVVPSGTVAAIKNASQKLFMVTSFVFSDIGLVVSFFKPLFLLL
jgi:hypothetical protein